MTPFNSGISKTTGCGTGASKTATFPFEEEVPTCPTLAEYTAVYNVFTNKPSAEDCEIQQTLVQSLVDASLWDSKLDRRFIMAIHTNDGGEAQLDYIDPVNNLPLLNVNGCTFTAYEGFQGDGLSQYLNTQYNPSVDGVLFTLNNCSAGGYNRINISINGNMILGAGAAVNSTSSTHIIPRMPPNLAAIRINCTTAGVVVNTDGSGEYVAVRANAADDDLFRNKIKIINGSNVSQVLTNNDFYIMAFNDGHPAFKTANQISKIQFGASYDQTDVNNEFTAFNDVYMTHYGKQIA